MQWLRVAAALEQQVHCWSLVAMAEYQRASSSSCVKLGQAEPNATDHQMMGVYCYARTTSTSVDVLDVERQCKEGRVCIMAAVAAASRQAGRQAFTT